MENFQEVVVGVALKVRTHQVPEGSRTAFSQALAAALETRAKLRIVHSRWHQGEILPMADEGNEALAGLVAEAVAKDVPVELDVTEQRAWLALVHRAQSDGELVVVGKRDVSGGEATSRRIGPVPSKLLRKCPAPVWVVRPDHDLSHKLVLVGTDLTAVGDRALEAGTQLVQASNGKLHVLHAFRVPMKLKLAASDMPDAEYKEQVAALKATARGALQERIHNLIGDQEVELHLSRKTPAMAIREAAEHLAPDLIVMGTLSRGGRQGVELGETAERLLGRLDCSLLTFKPQGFTSPVPS